VLVVFAIAMLVLAVVFRPVTPSGSGQPVDGDIVSSVERSDAIARAQIWRQPEVPIARADLRPRIAKNMECFFEPDALGGTTPKFHCVLADGKEVRAKYGFGGEIPAETAATRLLSALGFGADRVTLVERVRCFGCPKEPFVATKVMETLGAQELYEKVVNHGTYEDFEWVALEDKFEAAAIESSDAKGWAFYELDLVDARRGGAPRAHVDAFRLLAVFLAHWDNKAENQRLVCLSGDWGEEAVCREPFLLLQDVGATFGPRKVDLASWERARIWDDRASCAISMREMPYGGGTFRAVRVSERGRQFLAGLLNELSEAQLTDLFAGARFDQPRSPLMQHTLVSEWVRVFQKRAKAITDGPPCPDA
jgi:hypothetical protein